MAAHALTDPVPHNTDWVLTGPAALSYDAVAAILTEVSGRPVRHRAVSEAELRTRLARHLPADFAAILADLDRRIAEDRVTDAVTRVTGRPPRSFAAYVRDNVQSLT
ncbi:hypothetical protein [Streptomyces noursei]|uniref:hypothetical protein n=1 Tax=Streptomyces noursei TaxID=1971 RepID=UPI0030F2ACE5